LKRSFAPHSLTTTGGTIHSHSAPLLSSLLPVTAIMPSWTDYVGFGPGLLGVLHLTAFIRPHGWVSRRLRPSFAAEPERPGTNYQLRQTVALEKLVELVEDLVKLEKAW
jgi:hypothetical protein